VPPPARSAAERVILRSSIVVWPYGDRSAHPDANACLLLESGPLRLLNRERSDRGHDD